jgi:hypothetical protein
VKSTAEDEGLSAEKLPRSWFSASVIHLRSKDEKDLFVAAEEKLRGANICPFWVFTDTPYGMKLVLSASAQDEWILNSRWRGYRNIELISMTCCEISRTWLRFEGGKYSEYRSSSEDNK